jgi:FkbM family methyltransferase
MILDTGLAERTARLWRRQRAARRLGTRFRRAASFALPRTIRINGRDVALAVPDEYGQRIAFVELLLDDCYHLRQLAGRAKIETVIDIGANVGLFGLAARAAFPNAMIHAYEPNPALEAALARHAEAVGVAYFLDAIGRDAGFISLDVQPGESVQSRSRSDPRSLIPQIAFRETLERIGGHADLVKMDCEGAEWEILEDPESWRRVDFLTMEYHLSEDQGHEAIVAALKRIGFAVRSHRPATNFGLVFAERAVR